MATSNPSKDRNLLAVIGDEVCHHFGSLYSRGRPCILGHNHGPFTGRDWAGNAGPQELLYRRA
jgi:hypothetical protein